MTLTTTFVVSSFGPGVRYTLVPDLEIYVDQAVIVTSTDDDAIRGADGRSSVVVAGRVTGHVAAVQLGDDLSIDALNLVTVEDNGRVHGGTLGIALLSSQSSLRNDGVITANFGAVTFGGDGETTSAVLNNGVISGRLLAVGVNANASETVSLANFGQIIATSEDGYAYLGGSGVDGVANGGHMQGDIELAEGNDTYDGRTGPVTDGVVSGGDGTTLFGPGTDRRRSTARTASTRWTSWAARGCACP